MKKVDDLLQEFAGQIEGGDIDDFEHDVVLDTGLKLVEGLSIAELRSVKRQIERTRYKFFMADDQKHQLLRSVLLLLVSTELRIRIVKPRIASGRF